MNVEGARDGVWTSLPPSYGLVLGVTAQGRVVMPGVARRWNTLPPLFPSFVRLLSVAVPGLCYVLLPLLRLGLSYPRV